MTHWASCKRSRATRISSACGAAVLAILGTSLPFWLWFASFENIGLNRANAFTFLVPILELGIGAALFGERLAVVQVAGVALVLGGIVLVQRGSIAIERSLSFDALTLHRRQALMPRIDAARSLPLPRNTDEPWRAADTAAPAENSSSLLP